MDDRVWSQPSSHNKDNKKKKGKRIKKRMTSSRVVCMYLGMYAQVYSKRSRAPPFDCDVRPGVRARRQLASWPG